ncbi:MAG: nuclear transport factor 2 family protein [Sphingomonadales bacterium]|nr:nuclear transport factor 2 family protein [Sphingomonadales bacterium]
MNDPALQRLLDEQAIRALAAAYSDAVTHLDPVAAAAVYAEDGVVEIVGNAIAGRAAIQAGMRDSFAAFSLLQLIEHGGVVTFDGDRAQARWSTVELAVRQGQQALNVIFGRYEDELVRTPEGWRFARRRFTLAGRTQVETAKFQFNPAFFGPAFFGR